MASPYPSQAQHSKSSTKATQGTVSKLFLQKRDCLMLLTTHHDFSPPSVFFCVKCPYFYMSTANAFFKIHLKRNLHRGNFLLP